MNIEHLKPIPESVKKIIVDRYDVQAQVYQNQTRYYAYLDTVDGELVKVTVAVKQDQNKDRFYKQILVHLLHDKKTVFVKDCARGYICGYITGWYYQGLSDKRNYWEDDEWGIYEGKFGVCARIVNLNYLHRTRYKYSGAVEYGTDNVLEYLRIWEKYPQVELLSKIGLGMLAYRKGILQKAAKDKAFVRWLSANREDIRRSACKQAHILYAYAHHITATESDTLHFFRKDRLDGFQYVIDTIPDDEYLQLAKYLREQNVSTATYNDYLKACLYLGLDMTQSKNRYPHELKRWHDIRTLEYTSKKAEEEEQKQNRIAEGVKQMAAKYGFLETGNDDYTVVIAKSKKELTIEGEYLHHCVGRMGYDAKIAEGRSLIFFLRLVDEPSIPYVTIEYDLQKHRVAQFHAVNNNAPAQPVRDYIEKVWAPTITRQLKQMKKAA